MLHEPTNLPDQVRLDGFTSDGGELAQYHSQAITEEIMTFDDRFGTMELLIQTKEMEWN